MGWYSPPTGMREALGKELAELSKCGESEMNAVLQVVSDGMGETDDPAGQLEVGVAMCDSLVEAATALREKLARWKAIEDDLTENQKAFIESAEEQGFDIDYRYSGRGMEGKHCPAVRVDRESEFHTDADYSTDAMGLGVVIYARS